MEMVSGGLLNAVDFLALVVNPEEVIREEGEIESSIENLEVGRDDKGVVSNGDVGWSHKLFQTKDEMRDTIHIEDDIGNIFLPEVIYDCKPDRSLSRYVPHFLLGTRVSEKHPAVHAISLNDKRNLSPAKPIQKLLPEPLTLSAFYNLVKQNQSLLQPLIESSDSDSESDSAPPFPKLLPLPIPFPNPKYLVDLEANQSLKSARNKHLCSTPARAGKGNVNEGNK
ncbi:hypothetical protein NE237_029817 [Protea cynaroides]|uniref:Uncharacterized protein n=1 Tax=Protea cynaroides TaxID=273540 RepID=A0A9Q0JWE9_9MAGN|nr:hypothetical protein NE237_029817 [Protea cynaroides]